jgi:Zn-dependent protease
MLPSLRLGKIFGFPIRIHWSFIGLLAVAFLFQGGVAGLSLVLLVAASVLAHELGHALVARRLNVRVSEIGLHFFGGAAQMADRPRTRRAEIAIALAGPAVSFVLAATGHGLAAVTGLAAFTVFGWVNVMLGAFNLLPAFPSDGGRVLRAWLAGRFGFLRATELAVTVGRVICVALAVLGIAWGAYQLVVVAAALWLFGTGELAAARRRDDHGTWDGAPPAARVEYLPPASWTSPAFAQRPIIVVVRR